MNGKNKCRILRTIRQQIAEANDLELITRECTYQGECSGTCPRCEAELRSLEAQLEKRRATGKRIAVAALATGIALTASGCELSPWEWQRSLAKDGGDVEEIELLGEATTMNPEETPTSELAGAVSESGE